MDNKMEIRRIIGETIGEASMLWSETPTGVFESDKAVKLIDKLTDLFSADRAKTIEMIDGLKADERKVATFGEWEFRTYEDKEALNAVLEHIKKLLEGK